MELLLNKKLKLNQIHLTYPSNEEVDILNNKNFIVEFSGGIDSTAAVAWLKYFFPRNKMLLLNVRTDVDFDSIQNHIEDCANFFNCDLKFLDLEDSLFDIFLKKGWPNPFHPYCQLLIFKRLWKEEKKFKNVLIIRGGNEKEKSRNQIHSKSYSKKIFIDRYGRFFHDYGNLGFEKHLDYFCPCYFENKQENIDFLNALSAPIWEGYFKGLQRTCCYICPGQSQQSYYFLKKEFPQYFSELKKLEKKLGRKPWNGIMYQGVYNKNPSFDQKVERFMERKGLTL